MTENDLPFFVRFWFAFVLLFRVIADGRLAARLRSARDDFDVPALPAGPHVQTVPERTPEPASPREGPGPLPPRPASDGALGLLALFQREGRLVDFLNQDLATFDDGEVGAAARVVHTGCRRALRAHVDVERVRTEPEGSTITLGEGFDAASIKLTGDVRGAAPFRGTLRHSGWRARQVRLPEMAAGYDATLLAPAELEL